MKDILTGLDRYEAFLDTLEKELANLGNKRIAITYTDIKHFKYINDTIIRITVLAFIIISVPQTLLRRRNREPNFRFGSAIRAILWRLRHK